jgi:predicted ATPase/DNA-binding CsgD family transcriptional regulator/Tfp pilus assembly protein PilF
MSTSSAALSQSRLLPSVLTPLLGRESELDHLQGLIDTPAVRLITLTGPGGVGKTRLVLHLATTLVAEFDRDVSFVPLASIRDPALVLPTIGQALGLPLDTSDTLENRVASELEARQTLLVLDNFEQLLDAAPHIEDLLARSPGTTILVTSQAALGIPGEQLYPLLPLPTPAAGLTTAEAILQFDAVALFIARARSIKPMLSIDDRMAVTIAEISRRLDGLPLAIELAAARSNILSPEALLARLSNRLQVLGSDRRGVPDRLRTIRHAIAWSYDLLTSEQQELFRSLSVFAGGFTLDAVEGLPHTFGANHDAFGTLSALVDHSLVQAQPQPSGENRFLMLETLREFGLEQLVIQGEEPGAYLAHANWFLHLAEEAGPHLVGRDQEAWLNRLDPEWDNIRAAVNWSFENGHDALALRLVGAIWRFCSARGHTTESRVFLERALATATGEKVAWRTRALVAAGNLAQNQRDLDTAQSLFEQARDLAIDIDHPADEVQALIGLAKVAVNRSDYATAIDFHQRAAALARKTGDQRAVGIALGGLAYVAYFQGKLDDAVGYWEEARQVVRELGDNLLESVAVSNLGAVATVRGEFDRAQRLLSRALELQRQMQAFDSLPYTLTNLADTWRQLGDYTLAEDLLAEAVSRFRELGYTGSEGTCLTSYAQLALDQGDRERAAAMLMESTRLIHEAGDQFPITENADVLAEICIDHGNEPAAIELLAASDAIRAGIAAEAKPLQLAHLKDLQQRLRTAVPEPEYERHRHTGAAYDIETLVRRITIIAREIVGTRLPPPIFPQDETPGVAHPLTVREVEVLGLLAQGKSTREISDSLFISPRTTTTHVNNILGKLEVTSRTAAVAWAMRNGLA